MENYSIINLNFYTQMQANAQNPMLLVFRILNILILCPEIRFVLLLLVVKLFGRNSAFQPHYSNPFHSYVEEISIAFPYHYIKVASNQSNSSPGCFLS